ncbi:phosphatidylserine decarboxylase [Neorhodopirellula pilleata]|uniref:Phosphatidylserine decarboxylase n=1 Tax=Neorhodopirellula pilleata TaxID=2714738 RepID=A0A5C6A882_9BACT|nr:phosphatidylserine decarboxylase [Neorhodopirellula pilleata]TWT95508.1 phosphatidylserine decarboxylase [Neorhodopirellula pilleata]
MPDTTPASTSAPTTPDVATDASIPAMDPAIKTIQPGGGVAMSLELAWGRLRRAYLRKIRPRYVTRMADRRQGLPAGLPFDPVDSRDMKYYRNQGSYWWADADDAFMWRDSLPFLRAGLAELIIIGGALLVLAAVLGWFWWPLSFPPLVGIGLLGWLFRDPRRVIPTGLATVVSPSDGKVVRIVEVNDPVIGPAIRFEISLSIWNVHAYRASLPGRVVSVRYRPRRTPNAAKPVSEPQNEHLDIELASPEISGRIIRIRQISGRFARRIVCWARVDDVFERGEMYGMIKLGSRTELVVPRDASLRVQTEVGDRVAAGTTVMARYEPNA